MNRVESFCDTMMIADMVKHLFFDDYNTYQLKQRELIELGGKVVANGRDDSESWVDVRVDNIVYKLVFYIKS